MTWQSSALPVSVAECKLHSNISHDADDALIEQYIRAAQSHAEILTGCRLSVCTFELDLETFGAGAIDLRPQLKTVDSIIYTDKNGDSSTFTDYTAKTTPLIGYVEPDDYWPGGEDILITFTAGFEFVPQDIKVWLYIKVADLYAQRESFAITNATISNMPSGFTDNLLSTYVVPGVGAWL